MDWKVFLSLGFTGLIVWLFKERLWEMLFSIPKLIISWWDRRQKRKDLIEFLDKWYSNSNNLSVSSGRLDVNMKNELGSYRLYKLIEPLKQLKVCTLFKAANYWCFANFQNNYNSADVERMIADVNKGVYDQYLQ